MAKIYAVKVGMQTGVFNSWADVEPLVKGYPGAKFKSFNTMAEANEYLGDAPVMFAAPAAPAAQAEAGERPAKKTRKKKNEIPDDADTRRFLKESAENPDKVIAYVDGSNDKDIPAYSYGAIFFLRGEKITCKKAGNDPRLIDLWNVAGEMSGAVKAVRFCKEHGIKKLDLYHDYNGIAAWAKNEWRAKTEGTAAYKKFMQAEMHEIKITFIWTKGHSGVELNEEADRLAKEAIKEFREALKQSA